MISQSITFSSKEGFKLAGIFTKPQKSGRFPIVIMVHGHTSSKDSDSYVELEKLLAKIGVSTLRFDFRGHSDSDGNYSEMTVGGITSDISSAIDYLFSKQEENLDKNHIILYGNSISGLSSLIVASQDKRVTHLITRAGVSEFESHLKDWWRADIDLWKKQGWITPHEGKARHKRLSYDFYEEAVSYDLKEIVQNIHIPALIVHGGEDQEVAVEQSQRVFDLLSSLDKVLKIIKGADHQFLGHRDEMQQIIVDWISGRLN